MSDVVFWLIILGFILILIGGVFLHRMIHSVYLHSRLVGDSVEHIFSYLEQLAARLRKLEDSQDGDKR